MMNYTVDNVRRKLPCRWRYLTYDERKIIANGCGGKGGFFNPPDYSFTASCDAHDFNYWLGHREENRVKADTQFLNALLADAARSRRWWTRLWLVGAAYRYYWAVRALGWRFFNYADVERGWDDVQQAVREAR